MVHQQAGSVIQTSTRRKFEFALTRSRISDGDRPAFKSRRRAGSPETEVHEAKLVQRRWPPPMAIRWPSASGVNHSCGVNPSQCEAL